jgi:hypothetical protein
MNWLARDLWLANCYLPMIPHDRLLGPGAVRSLLAESLLLKHRLLSKRRSQTVLTIWLTEILPGVFRQSARPSPVAHLVRSADGLIGPARGFAR